ncbi:MAG: DNA adenine methylase [Acetivibrionales bacterium]|jgi:DNA adenine methylase
MPRTESPLRYPGGKTKLYNLIKPIISQNIFGNNKTYIEPFAGGSGLALKLLHNGDVDRLVLNDIDYCIYCFWDACLHNADEICSLIEDSKINIDTWNEKREIYKQPEEHSCLEVGFATLFMNRCNVSGVICGGPIGGYNQTGSYKLDARFNKDELIRKILRIYKNRDYIKFYNEDAKNFIQNLPLDCRYNETILNIDPPYVKKGPLLYKNSFSIDDHSELAQIIQAVEYKWIVTYDECDTIYNLYSNFRKEIITLKYSVGHSRSGRELMIYSDDIELKNFQICF